MSYNTSSQNRSCVFKATLPYLTKHPDPKDFEGLWENIFEMEKSPDLNKFGIISEKNLISVLPHMSSLIYIYNMFNK